MLVVAGSRIARTDIRIIVRSTFFDTNFLGIVKSQLPAKRLLAERAYLQQEGTYGAFLIPQKHIADSRVWNLQICPISYKKHSWKDKKAIISRSFLRVFALFVRDSV